MAKGKREAWLARVQERDKAAAAESGVADNAGARENADDVEPVPAARPISPKDLPLQFEGWTTSRFNSVSLLGSFCPFCACCAGCAYECTGVQSCEENDPVYDKSRVLGFGINSDRK